MLRRGSGMASWYWSFSLKEETESGVAKKDNRPLGRRPWTMEIGDPGAAQDNSQRKVPGGRAGSEPRGLWEDSSQQEVPKRREAGLG